MLGTSEVQPDPKYVDVRTFIILNRCAVYFLSTVSLLAHAKRDFNGLCDVYHVFLKPNIGQF